MPGAKSLASLPVTVIVTLVSGVPIDVESVSVDVAAAVPLITTGDALKEQMGGGVAPVMLLQERLTLPVYPLTGVAVTAEVAVPPAVTEAGLNAAAPSV